MAIHYTMTGEDDTLVVEASGFDESLEEVQQYGMKIIQAAREGGFTRILCNEYALEYRLGTLDTYESASFISEQAGTPNRVAIVCHPQFMADARFWEDVAVNRGLSVRFFRELDAARAWLHGGSGRQALR